MYNCPVCEYPKLQEPPRSTSGGGSYEICPSCGFQFGVDDDDRGITYTTARETWISGGRKWYSRSRKQPADWPPLETTGKPVKKAASKKASAKAANKKAVKKATSKPTSTKKVASKKTPKKK